MAKFSTFDKAKTRLVMVDPFFATIIMGLTPVFGEKLPNGKDLWLAATDGTSLFINPTAYEALPLPEAVGVLKHEAMHVALMHPFRRGTRTAKRWNNAADYVINPLIVGEGGALPPKVLDGSPFKGMTTEQVYAALPEDEEGDDDGDGDGGGDGGNPLGDDLMDAPDKSSVAEAKVKANVAQAAQVAKAMGKMPGAIRELLDDVFSPTVSWLETLREFLTETSRTDYSFARPNRRFVAQNMYLPALYGTDGMRKLGVVVDTSGSIGVEELKQFFGEICGAVDECAPSQLVVTYCAAEVNHVDRFDGASSAEVKSSAKRVGGGGTNMVAALEWFEEHEPDTAAVIVLTDGYTPFGDDRTLPVLWAITSDIVSPVGTTVRVGV